MASHFHKTLAHNGQSFTFPLKPLHIAAKRTKVTNNLFKTLAHSLARNRISLKPLRIAATSISLP